MRILAVTTSYPHPADPAAGRFVRHLHEGLVAEGHTVFTVHPAPGRQPTPFDGPAGTVWPIALPTDDARRLVGLGGMEANARAMGVFRARAALRAVEEALVSVVRDRLRDADLVLAHWAYPSAAWTAALCRNADKPLVAVAHGGDMRLLARPLLGFLPRLRLRGALAGLVATWREGGDQLADRLAIPPEARLVTPMGYDASVFHRGVIGDGRPGIGVGALSSGAAAVPSVALGAPQGAVVAAGRLVPIKGFDVLLRALVGLGRPLRLAGDGPERPALERLARALGVEVVFLGALPPESLADEFRRAAVVVVPSRRVAGGSEGFPMVALEALACGAPVVASAVGGLPEVLPADALVPPDDPSALAAALRRFLSGTSRPAPVDVGAYTGPAVARRVSEFLKARSALRNR